MDVVFKLWQIAHAGVSCVFLFCVLQRTLWSAAVPFLLYVNSYVLIGNLFCYEYFWLQTFVIQCTKFACEKMLNDLQVFDHFDLILRLRVVTEIICNEITVPEVALIFTIWMKECMWHTSWPCNHTHRAAI